MRGERQQRGETGDRPQRSSRAGDRFALALISLALDEVDATQVPDGCRGSERAHTPELSSIGP
jgi:hypothetical protein